MLVFVSNFGERNTTASKAASEFIEIHVPRRMAEFRYKCTRNVHCLLTTQAVELQAQRRAHPACACEGQFKQSEVSPQKSAPPMDVINILASECPFGQLNRVAESKVKHSAIDDQSNYEIGIVHV